MRTAHSDESNGDDAEEEEEEEEEMRPSTVCLICRRVSLKVFV